MIAQERLQQAQQERDQLLHQQEEAKRQAQIPQQQLDVAERRIAEAESDVRAERFDALVQENDVLAITSDDALVQLQEHLDALLVYLNGLDTASLAKVYQRASSSAEAFEEQSANAKREISRFVEQDKALLPSTLRVIFDRVERMGRFVSKPRRKAVHNYIDEWFDAAKPGTGEALKRALILSLAVDRTYLDQWEESLLKRRERRMFARHR